MKLEEAGFFNKMAIDVLKKHVPGIQEHGIVTDATVTLTGTVTLPDGVILNDAPLVLTSDQLTTVSASAVYTVGTRAFDSSHNEYVFLSGLTGVVAGTWVSYDENFAATLLTTSSVGAVAVAMAAIVGSKWGWFQIYGEGSGIIGNEVSGDLRAYISSVTGSIDDLMVTGDLIHGAFIRSASAVTGAAVTVQLNYPFTDQASGSY